MPDEIQQQLINTLLDAKKPNRVKETECLELIQQCDVNFRAVALEPDSVRIVTPLHLAAEIPDLFNVVHALLNRGALVDALDDDRRTALHITAIKGNRFAAELLVAEGANVNARDKAGYLPQDYANPLHPELAMMLQGKSFPTLFSIAAKAAASSSFKLAPLTGVVKEQAEKDLVKQAEDGQMKADSNCRSSWIVEAARSYFSKLSL